MSLMVYEPHPAVRPDPRLGDEAFGSGNAGQHSGSQVVAEEPGPPLEQVPQQKGRTVRPPVLYYDDPVELQAQVGPFSGPEIPDGRSFVALPLVHDGQAGVAGDGRPAPRRERHPFVHLFTEDGPGPRVDDSKCGVDEVAVLAVFEAQVRAIRGQPAPNEPPPIRPADLDRLGTPPYVLGWAALDRDEDGESIPIAVPGGHHSGSLGQPTAPPVGHAGEEWTGLSPVERLNHPAARLVPGLVLEPQNGLAVERRHAVGEPDWVIGDLPAHPRRSVPRVDLPDPALRRGEHQPVGCVGRPLGQVEDGPAKPLLPPGDF